jgi:hypothetical protein
VPIACPHARSDHPRMRPLKELLQRINRRLAFALSAYAVLVAIATFALEGALRAMVWAFFAFLTYKTLRAPRMDE